MGRKSAKAVVIIRAPETEEGKRALARLTARVHADAAGRGILKLGCPIWQKLDVLDAVIKAAEKDEKSG